MKNFLVLGDSYAQLDSENSHWARLWAERDGNTTTHFGYPGHSHTNIASTARNIDFSQYDGVIYHITDFLRLDCFLQLSNHDENFQNEYQILVKKISQATDLLSNEEYVEYLINCDNPFANDSFHSVDQTRVQSSMIDPSFPLYEGVDLLTKQNANTLYRYISIPWLFRANWNSMLYLRMLIKTFDKPFIGIMPSSPHTYIPRHIKGSLDFNIWEMASALPSLETQGNVGENHISLRDATVYANKFAEENLLTGLFKTS